MPLLTKSDILKNARSSFISSIIEDDWKLIQFYNDEDGAYLLYDLGGDPEEQNNLADVNVKIRDKLLHQLEVSLMEMKAELSIPNPGYTPDTRAVRKNLKFTKDLAEKERGMFEERLSKPVSD